MQRSDNVAVSAGIDRRVFLGIPVVIGGLWLLLRGESRHLPDPASEGSGVEVELLLCRDNGTPIGVRRLRKIVKTEAQWRKELSSEAFAICRRGATEFAYANRYWNEKRAGIYRCICCGTALFRAADKFDSGTGWPSFTAPISKNNVGTLADNSLVEARTEVRCHKCDAHIGHVFADGPPPAGQRYCMNSGAMRFCQAV